MKGARILIPSVPPDSTSISLFLIEFQFNAQVDDFLSAAMSGDLKRVQLSLENAPHIIEAKGLVRLHYML